MTRQRNRRYLVSAAYLLLPAMLTLTNGCARLYHATHYNWVSKTLHEYRRPYFHSDHTGRIIAKEHGHYDYVTEPGCFGYESTCWHAWPPECPTCPPPEQILKEEVISPEVTPAADAPAQSDETQGDLQRILDLDDPQPGEQPLIRDPDSQGTGAVLPKGELPKGASEQTVMFEKVYESVRKSGVGNETAATSKIGAQDSEHTDSEHTEDPWGELLNSVAKDSDEVADQTPEDIQPLISFVEQPARVELAPEPINLSLGTSESTVEKREPVVTQLTVKKSESVQSGSNAASDETDKDEQTEVVEKSSRRSSRRTIRFAARSSADAVAPQQISSTIVNEHAAKDDQADPSSKPVAEVPSDLQPAAPPSSKPDLSPETTMSVDEDSIPSFTIVPASAIVESPEEADGESSDSKTLIRFMSGPASSTARTAKVQESTQESSIRFR